MGKPNFTSPYALCVLLDAVVTGAEYHQFVIGGSLLQGANCFFLYWGNFISESFCPKGFLTEGLCSGGFFP